MKIEYADFFYGASSEILVRAEMLRKNMTDTEVKLWKRLRKKQVAGLTFRRQHSIGSFIVDFYCHAALLVVEVDGGIHLKGKILTYDRNRESQLIELGLMVLRFTNDEIDNDLENVISSIKSCSIIRCIERPPAGTGER